MDATTLPTSELRCRPCDEPGVPARLLSLEVARRTAGLSQSDVARECAISERTYRRFVSGDLRKMTGQKLSGAARRIARIERAIARLQRPNAGYTDEVPLIRATYAGFVLALAPAVGVTPEAVAAADPRANLGFDPTWRTCRHVAQAALYLTNTSLGVRQKRLAEALGLTPAAVCLALRAVEERRDDPEFDRLMARASKIITGREE